MDLIFKNTPWTLPTNGEYGTVVITDSMTGWYRDYWVALTKPYAPTAPVFVPKFLTGKVSDQFGNSWPLNSDYLADKDTAQFIATKYGNGQIRQQSSYQTGGAFQATEQEWWFQKQNGEWVNAGIIAAYYIRNPESDHPGLADKMIQDVLK